MTWDQILDHQFVKGKITILDEESTDSPFTHPLTNSQNLEKERQTKQIENTMRCFAAGASNYHMKNADRKQYPDEPTSSSRDSNMAILQSDIENFETDNDNDDQKVPEPCDTLNREQNIKPDLIRIGPNIEATDDVCYVTGNYNLIVNRLNDNLQYFSNATTEVVKKSLPVHKSKEERKYNSRELEKRKLSQNLDNFSLRLGKSSTNHPLATADTLEATNSTNEMEQPR